MNTPVMNDRLVMEDSPEERQAGQGALSYEETTLKKKKGPSCYSTPLWKESCVFPTETTTWYVGEQNLTGWEVHGGLIRL